MKKFKIAIVGSGISGLSCAHYLSKKHEVDLYEKNNYFGGHTHTQTISSSENEIDVDSGFIVFNQINYPNLCKLFNELNVETYESDMSFSVSNRSENLEYSGTNISTIFCQRSNLFNKSFLKMLFEIFRFNNSCKNDVKFFKNLTIDEYLTKNKYSDFYKYNHLYPMASSIWSSEIEDIKKYPFEKLVIFFQNHGLLKIFNRPKWRTVLGGSKKYVEKILLNKNINAYKNSKVSFQSINKKKIFLSVNDVVKKYDHLVIATHSDQVKDVLKSQMFDTNLFDNIKYSRNIVYLHNDETFMPRIRSAWSSWNYIKEDIKNSRMTVTYWMNKLQKLKTKQNIFVSLNPYVPPKKKLTFKKMIYEHPIFDFKTFRNQKKIQSIQGIKNLWFCGAYQGFGFHEDGLNSALNVVSKILKKTNE